MIGYLDLPSGLSGDMFLSCLIDAGWSLDELRRAIASLNLPEGSWSIETRRVMKGAIEALQTLVTAPDGSPASSSTGGTRLPLPPQRNLADIQAILDRSSLAESVKHRANAVFMRLAAAEAQVHGTTLDEVHFHEVGAIDSIIDIVGVCAGIEALDLTRLYASPIPLGNGWVKTAHGKLPVPAPATLLLLAAVHAPTCPAPGPGELLTPTAAALLAEVATFEQPAIKLLRIAVGAGERDCPWPNVARLWLGEAGGAAATHIVIETNIDDMNPQFYAPVMEQLFARGALDVWLTPVQMKKGRPGVVLSVLAEAVREEELARLMLRQTTTIGVRVREVRRHEAARRLHTVPTPFGPIHVKVKSVDGQIAGIAPEFEDCRRAAEAARVPVSEVYGAAMEAARSRPEFRLQAD